uniref:Inositol polyphosphate 5phosphatase putative n=1 Tax=Albugo laibachii Nc14 TaxID=890382 RepID=F0WMP1_9STRA|nr:inositol polyphosphate 5phosphatase putative [Albugo laibachii Nc14]|eukprot:CCA22575.1 inositol polyphosphate 5phosphatase putative [Albugo laibachii Nc14]
MHVALDEPDSFRMDRSQNSNGVMDAKYSAQKCTEWNPTHKSSSSAPSSDNSDLSTISSSSYSLLPTVGDAVLAADGRYHNPVVMSFIRDDWIKQQLHLRQSAYTSLQDTRIVMGTWNVNAKKPLALSEASKIAQWIRGSRDTNESINPDIVAIGLQEIVDLNAVNVVVNNHSVQRSNAWEETILHALNTQFQPENQYKTVMEKHLVGISLLLFVRKDHWDHVKEVAGATAGVGIMGMMGNKGGAAIRLSFYDSSICFVCSHLAAHRENVAGRNADFQNILSKVDFEKENEHFVFKNEIATQFFSREPSILHHDFVFWAGDLNYRITDDISTEECFKLSESSQSCEMLLPHDQLLIERRRGNVFHGFEEASITFPPTYKFQAGTSRYDKRPEKKIRAPAWCDRVLWKSKCPTHVKNINYDAIMDLDISDHKPVYAHFMVKIKHQIEAKKQAITKEIIYQLDRWENENMPKVVMLHRDNSPLLDETLPPSLVQCSGVFQFTNVRFQVPQQKRFVLENIGNVVAHFRFIPKLEDTRICKNWISVTPSYGMILPKESVEIRMDTMVDIDAAQKLAEGSESLEDTLILRVENGRDFFLAISGEYQISCFGCSIEQLVQYNEPIRRALTSERASDAQHQQIPKELWRIIDDLYQFSLGKRNLFVEAGNPSEMQGLREALDTGSTFPTHSAHSMAEVLLTFLQSLNENVIREDFLSHAYANGHGNIAQTCRQLLHALPPLRYNIFIYILAFLKEVLVHQQSNMLTPEKLSYVFSRCLVAQYRPRACREYSIPAGMATFASPNTFIAANTSESVDLLEFQDYRAPSSSRSAQSNASSNTTGPSSSSSAHKDTAMIPLAGDPLPVVSDIIPLEEKLRRNAREQELAQQESAIRAGKMDKLLVFFLTTKIT